MADSWKEQTARIRGLHLKLSTLDPELGLANLAADHGASKRAISAAERKMRRRLPPSYRAFLGEHDGWGGFFQGASLLGVDELGRPRYAEMVRAAFEAYETPVSDIAPRSRASSAGADPAPDCRPDAVIPFGCDAVGHVLFAFNPGVVRPDGEMEVVAWIYAFGYRFETFAEFLAMVGDVLEAEIDERPASLRKSA